MYKAYEITLSFTYNVGPVFHILCFKGNFWLGLPTYRKKKCIHTLASGFHQHETSKCELLVHVNVLILSLEMEMLFAQLTVTLK